MIKKIFITSILLILTAGLYYSAIKQTDTKQNILHKKTSFSRGYTKPRSTFVIRRLENKNENSIRLLVEVVGPFDHYEFNWWLPNGTQITSGDSNGYVDASTKKTFTHEIEFANLNDKEQIVFEAHLFEGENKLGATYIYTSGDQVNTESLKSSTINKIESMDGSKIRVMQ